MRSATYNTSFYDETLITAGKSAKVIVPLILKLANVKSVVDVGCGTGSWLAAFQENGVADILGVDKESVAYERLQIPDKFVVKYDLVEQFSLERKFDLAMCLEVAEHLPESSSKQIVKNLTALAPMVLFSAAIPHQGGTNHVNEQWPEYWSALFQSCGYRAIDCLREDLWQEEDVAYWYAQNLILYVKQDVISEYPQLARYAKTTNPMRLTLIHPKNYVKNYYLSTKPSVLLMRSVWNALPKSIRMMLFKPLASHIWKHVGTKYQ